MRVKMISDDCLVECPIDDDDEESLAVSAPPPPEFASKDPTPSPKPPTPSTAPAAPVQMPLINRDPYGINQHLKPTVHSVCTDTRS